MIKFLRKKLEETRNSAGDSGEQLKPFLEHLEDLRVMIIRIAGAVAIGFSVTCFYTPRIVDFLQKPLEPLMTEVSPEIATSDLVDLPSFIHKLDQPAGTLTSYIRENLSPSTWPALTNYLAVSTDELRAQKALAIDLNTLISDKSFYSTQRFTGIELRPGTRQQLELDPRGEEERLRLNRMLLEDAFPREISRHWKPKHQNLIRSGDNVAGGFNLMMTVSFWSGLLLASPFIIYFIVNFVAPALTERERKVVRQTSILALLALILGLLLGWNYGLPAALAALIWFNDWMHIETWWTINNYISFTTLMLAAFGGVFEIPVVILILGRLGIISSAWLRQYRRHAIVANLCIAAVITPSPDVASQLLIAVPLIVLYEVCIWVIYAQEKRRTSSALVQRD
jgi:sec-independent protein translocase protein TatC